MIKIPKNRIVNLELDEPIYFVEYLDGESVFYISIETEPFKFNLISDTMAKKKRAWPGQSLKKVSSPYVVLKNIKGITYAFPENFYDKVCIEVQKGNAQYKGLIYLHRSMRGIKRPGNYYFIPAYGLFGREVTMFDYMKAKGRAVWKTLTKPLESDKIINKENK